MKMLSLTLPLLTATAVLPVAGLAQGLDFPTAAGIQAGAQMRARYAMTPNIVYLTANSFEAKLDVYSRIDSQAPMPTLIFIHGGGWQALNKEYAVTAFMPWLMMGWNVVNVEYRFTKVSPAPAAIEDCLCALRWTATNAAMYHFDVKRIVVAGESAGGHLALTTGMIPEATGLARECPGAPLPRVAAMVDWFGPTDLGSLLEGADTNNGAISWLGSAPNREERIRLVSPMTYVKPGLPPIFIIHGTADPTVPYDQSVKLHQALDKAGDPNVLYTVQGGTHGHFSPDELVKIYGAISQFLIKNGVAINNPH